MHYALWALVTREQAEVKDPHVLVERVVAYFDMGREVEPYDVPCLCLDPTPQVDCEECNGTGLMEVDYPVDSRFDWFSVGGRWSGRFDGTRAGRNVIPVAELEPGMSPSVIVAPDGTWHVNSDLDDGSRNSAEPDAPRTVQVRAEEWDDLVARLLAEHERCLVVVADMHA